MPSTLTWCAVIGVNSERVDSSAARWKISSTSNSARMRSSRPRSRIDPVISRSTFLAIAGSSGATSSVTMARSASLGEPSDQAVTDLAAGAGDEHDRFTHAAELYWPSCRGPARCCSLFCAVIRGRQCRRVAPIRADRLAASRRSHRRHSPVRLHEDDAGRLLPHRRTRDRRDASRSIASSTTAPGREAGRSSSTDQSRKVPVRGARQVDGRGDLLARASRRSTASGRRPRRSRPTQRTFHESMRFPWPSGPVTRDAAESGRPTTRSRDVWSVDVDPASSSSSTRRRRRARRSGLDGDRERTGAAEGRPADHRRGLHASAELPKFHDDVKRLSDRSSPRSRSRAGKSDFNVRGTRPAVGAERHQPAERRRVPADAALGGVQHLRLRALRADARQPRAARRGVGRAVRVHRDPRQRQDLRRRRHLQRSGDGVGGQRVLRTTSSSTSSGTTSRRSPTSTTRRTSPTRPAPSDQPEPWEPNVTALKDPAALKWRDLVDAWHAAAHAVGEGTLRSGEPRDPGAAPRDPRRATRPKRRWMRSSARSASVRNEAAGRNAVRADRSARSKAPPTSRAASTGRRPTASCSRATRRLLPRLPAGDRADHRSVLEVRRLRARASGCHWCWPQPRD